ncbi:MAG: methyltransferase domain-containing protein [Gordonia sp. (in: high G+C Gram-positive bacteria)]|uniref:class I SAM-dependent methyltransferase n=1 Tax=Gordonia sp. (in: high G+C Gram-positive bacteria) TaxID=84139 RepID=UPI0039E396FA
MPTIAQRLMGNPVMSAVYERLWRPTFTRLFSLGGTGTAEFDRAFTAYLARPGDRQILDVACGPGNYTRKLAENLDGDGRCIGIDFSRAMLARAAEKPSPRTCYIRGDAHRLPFPDESFDTVACLAALYLIPDPLPVVDELVRVTKPGGEIAIFTSVETQFSRLHTVQAVGAVTGYHFFKRHEITDRLQRAGITRVEQTVIDQGQFVLARKDQS